MACTPASSAAAANRPRISIAVGKNVQDVQRGWQELGVEAPRIEIKECLGSVLKGANRRKERDATAQEAVCKVIIN